MVRPGMLDNTSVKAWLGGVEPVWTLLDYASFSALVMDSEPQNGPVRLAVDLTAAELALSPVVRNMCILLQTAAGESGLKLTATGNLTRAVVSEMCDVFSWPGFEGRGLPLHQGGA